MKKVHKNKEGKIEAIELTGKDAKKLCEEIEEERRNTDRIPCGRCKGDTLHKKQENNKWSCQRCGTEISELDRGLNKGCEWYELKKGFDRAEDRVFGKYKL